MILELDHDEARAVEWALANFKDDAGGRSPVTGNKALDKSLLSAYGKVQGRLSGKEPKVQMKPKRTGIKWKPHPRDKGVEVACGNPDKDW